MKKTYVFYYHYYRQYRCMSVHYKGVCYRTKNVICEVDTYTKWNKVQPYLVIRGKASEIIIEDNKITIK